MIRKRKGVRRGPADVPPEMWRNPGFLQFLRERGICLPCYRKGSRVGPCEPCHGPVNGMSSKGPDAEAIPMCRAHHEKQHQIGWPAFELKYRFSRKEVAAAWWSTYQKRKQAA